MTYIITYTDHNDPGLHTVAYDGTDSNEAVQEFIEDAEASFGVIFLDTIVDVVPEA